MDPNLIQQILASGSYDPQAEQAKRKQAMIDALRERSMQSPPTRMAGRLVASNFGDVASNAIGGYRAEQMQPGVDEAMQQAGQRQTNARKGYYQALVEALRRQAPGMMNPNPNPSPVGQTPVMPGEFGGY